MSTLAGSTNTSFSGQEGVVASTTSTGNTSALTNAINYTPSNSPGIYRLSFFDDITAFTSGSHTWSLSYKDASGTAITDQVPTLQQATGNVVFNPGAVGRYTGSVTFQIDKSATAITLSTTGAGLVGTYNFAAILERLL